MYLPLAATENGAIMAANVLNSPQAVRMRVFVVRAFVQMRDLLGGTKELAKQLAELERKLTARLDAHENAMVEPMTICIDEYCRQQLPENALHSQTEYRASTHSRRMLFRHAHILAVTAALACFGHRPGAATAQSSNATPSFPAKVAIEGFPEVNDLPVRKEMPDALTMNDGTKVESVDQWRRRREEMRRILEHYELGHAPPPPGNVTGRDIKSSPLLDGAVLYRLVHLKFGPGEKLGFDIAIFTPAKGDGPFPTLINPSFFSTPGVAVTNPPAMTTTNLASTNSAARPGRGFGGPVDPETAARGFTNLLNRGYAIVTYRYTQCGEDNIDFRNSSFYPAYPDYDWGLLRGWAWGLSRVVDYLETQPFADKGKLIALGHSRLGKLVMVATAFDERISMGAPAGSSGAGTGAYRFCGPGRGGKEGIEDMTRKFPFYFVPRLKEFTGQMEKLPFDAHWFIALAAPRPWISVEGTDDQNCVPNSVRQSVLAARPVYAFLGANPDRVGVNYEPHRHGLTPADWTAALDFADKHLRGIKVERRFDQFPAEPAPPTPQQTPPKPQPAS